MQQFQPAGGLYVAIPACWVAECRISCTLEEGVRGALKSTTTSGYMILNATAWPLWGSEIPAESRVGREASPEL